MPLHCTNPSNPRFASPPRCDDHARRRRRLRHAQWEEQLPAARPTVGTPPPQPPSIRARPWRVFSGMLDSVSSVGPSWPTRNLQLLTWFAPLLLAAGVLGFVVPARLALMSGAPAYNVFHLVAGTIGLFVAWRRSAAGAIAFNLTFGAVDLYQALAGLTGLFPDRLFALRPADHALHVGFGLLLVGVGYLGKKSS
jgi:hypothetical protein